MKPLVTSTLAVLLLTPLASSAEPVHLHPQNPRVFEYRGKPRVLITATEHYGAVMNRPFDFERYLADAADKRMTLTRLFVLFRELQTPFNPYSTCKPESTDYVAPYLRTGPGVATDGLPKFDLDRWNPEFFERLHGFLGAASRHGIIVEITLFSCTYKDSIWSLNPLHPANNLNGTEKIQWHEYLSARHPRLLARQQTLVRKIVAECNRYDNVIFEICNEPFGWLPPTLPPGARRNPDGAEMDRWQLQIASILREVEAGLPNRHLVSGMAAYTIPAIGTEGLVLTEAFKAFPVDVVNTHGYSNTVFAGRSFNLGGFMTADLRLADLRDLFLATAGERKPLNLDEDNSASRFTDATGWMIHRKRAWTTVLNGGHYDMIDFTIQNRLEAGTLEAQRNIRTWLKHLSTFVHSLDLAGARPMPQMMKQAPEHVIASVLGVESKEYAIYLADAREVTEKSLGDPIRGNVLVSLPAGQWQASFLDPCAGSVTEGPTLHGGEATIALPEFKHDVALHLKRKDSGGR